MVFAGAYMNRPLIYPRSMDTILRHQIKRQINIRTRDNRSCQTKDKPLLCIRSDHQEGRNVLGTHISRQRDLTTPKSMSFNPQRRKALILQISDLGTNAIERVDQHTDRPSLHPFRTGQSPFAHDFRKERREETHRRPRRSNIKITCVGIQHTNQSRRIITIREVFNFVRTIAQRVQN